MKQRHVFAVFMCLGLCACGGSGGGGGGGGGAVPLNLTNFQVAGDIIGQSAAAGQTANNGGGLGFPNQSGLAQPGGHVANGSVYVADGANNRVLGFNAIPTGLAPNADFVLGAANFTTVGGGTSATLLSGPASCWVAGNSLFVADGNNERVLLYSPPPTATNAPAAVALGKPDLVTQGATGGASGLGFTSDVCVASNRVVVADQQNNRVVIWNGVPVVSGAPAQLVVGQPDFVTTSAGTSQTKMSSPTGVWTDGTRLVVCEATNNRVLIWNTFPTSNGQAADLVIGQPDFITATAGVGALKMNQPQSVASDGFQLFVADLANNRVLIYSPFPTVSNAAATGVLGQNSFTNVAGNDDDQDGASDASPTGRTLFNPSGVTTIGNQVFVNDRANHRVLIFTGS